MREIRHILEDSTFIKLALVPLEDTINPATAIVFEETFWELKDRGCSDYWCLNKDNTPIVWVSSIKSPVSVSRLISKAGKGQGARLVDGDKHNLRTNNIRLYDLPSAKRCEWDFIEPNTKDAKPVCRHIYEYPTESYWLKGVNQIHASRQALERQKEALQKTEALFRGIS
jgi:hypothetical protein